MDRRSLLTEAANGAASERKEVAPVATTTEEQQAQEDELARARRRGKAAAASAPAEDSIEALAQEPQEPEEPKPTPPMQVPLPGDWDTISTEFGGKAPESSEIRLLGGKLPIEGSFPKGTEFDVLVRVKVTGVLGQDVTDEWGAVTRTVRRHMARMISVRRAG